MSPQKSSEEPDAPNRYVTIRISTETHQQLRETGRMGDSFDRVIRMLLEERRSRPIPRLGDSPKDIESLR